MKRSLIALAAATAIGTAAFAFAASAHSDSVGRGGWGPGAMMGSGMMGHGAGMMGYGAGMGPAMMGGDYDDMPCANLAATNGEPLTLDGARQVAERRLEWYGNDRLKLGKVEAKDDDSFVAEIVTVDGSLVDTLRIDRKTGFMVPVR